MANVLFIRKNLSARPIMQMLNLTWVQSFVYKQNHRDGSGTQFPPGRELPSCAASDHAQMRMFSNIVHSLDALFSDQNTLFGSAYSSLLPFYHNSDISSPF